MRKLSLAVGAFAVVLAMAGGAEAQYGSPSEALSTSHYGTMSCGQFSGLAAAERDKIVRDMVTMAPARSLTTTTTTAKVDDQGNTIEFEDGGMTTNAPLSVGDLIAACQASNPSASLRDAFSRSNSGSVTIPAGQ